VKKEEKRPATKPKPKKKPVKEKPAAEEKDDKEKQVPAKDTKPKPAAKKQKISIKEIPHDKLTAQDILDELEEIPDYEDVFRHVNRDQEEIKPK
jgi:hypothetical protein